MKHLLWITAVIEAGAGAALIGFPSRVMDLLLGPSPDAQPSATVVRVIGGALLALGLLCWLASRDTQRPCAGRMVAVMTAYNPCAAIALGAIGMRAPSVGIVLWPAVVLHTAMAGWCIMRV